MERVSLSEVCENSHQKKINSMEPAVYHVHDIDLVKQESHLLKYLIWRHPYGDSESKYSHEAKI